MAMRASILMLSGLSALTASCHRAPTALNLADGCYYAGGKPVFKIEGKSGRMLIPGDVQTFNVFRGVDSMGAYATFAPGFFFDKGNLEGVPMTVGTDPGREPFRQSMKPGTQTPTIEMNWATYGHEDAVLGKSC